MKGFSAVLADPFTVVDGERVDDVFPAVDLAGHFCRSWRRVVDTR